MANWSVTVTDIDPERLSVTHMFQVRLEYAPRTDPERPGGSFTFDVPGQHWAHVIGDGMGAMTEEEVYALVDQWSE